MNALSKKSLVAASSIFIASSLLPMSVNAQTACMSGLPISIIANSGPSGYSCELGGLNYTFFNNLAELDNPNAIVNFQDSPNVQVITFANLTHQGDVGFFYKIISPYEEITDIELFYYQDPSFPYPELNGVFTAPTLPKPPSPIYPLTVETIFMPDTSIGSPSQTLISLTHKIYKTPAPLPLAGAYLAFGFSRKIRRRISNSKS